MIVNKSSWHYKWWKKCGGNCYSRNVSLCSYVQRIFWMSLVVAIPISVIASCAGVILYGFGCAFYYHTVNTFIYAGLFILLCSIILGICYFFIEYLPNKKTHSDDPDKEPGIIGQWLQAKKDKVCPIIDFED